MTVGAVAEVLEAGEVLYPGSLVRSSPIAAPPLQVVGEAHLRVGGVVLLAVEDGEDLAAAVTSEVVEQEEIGDKCRPVLRAFAVRPKLGIGRRQVSGRVEFGCVTLEFIKDEK